MTIATTSPKYVNVYKGLRTNIDKIAPTRITTDQLSKINNYFEFTKMDCKTRPFLDIDTRKKGIVFENKEHFDRIDNAILNILKTDYPNYSLLHASHYEAESYVYNRKTGQDEKSVNPKISFRLTDYSQYCKNMDECKYYSMEVMSEIVSASLGKYMDYVEMDTSVYRHGKFSCVNNYKFPQQSERYRKLINGTVDDTLIQVLSGNEEYIDLSDSFEEEEEKQPETETLKKVSPKVTQKKPKYPLPKTLTKTKKQIEVPNESYSLQDKHVDLLLNYLKNPDTIDFAEFIQVGIALKNNQYPMRLWYDWSQLNDFWKKDNAVAVPIKWEEFHLKHYPMEIIYKLCKKHEPTKWTEWKKKYLTNHNTIPIEDLQKGEIGIIKYILPELRQKIKYTQKRFYICNDKNLWIRSHNCYSIIGKTIHTYIDNSILKIASELDNDSLSVDDKDRMRKQRDKYCEFYKMTSKSSFLNNIETQFKTELYDQEFYDMLDSNPNFIAFKNGLWDLEQGHIRPICVNDNLSQTLNFDYEESNEEHRDEVREQIKKICNYSDEDLDYYLSTIAHSFTGLAQKEKALYFLIGVGGNNGKTSLIEALTDIAPLYVKKTDSEMIETRGKDTHKYLADLKGKRFVWLDEMRQDKELNEKMLKLLGEGTSIPYKVMYGETASLKVRFKLYCITNHDPLFTTDGGLQNRTRVLKFNSQFHNDIDEEDYENKNFKADPFIAEKWRTSHKMAIFDILFKYAKMYYEDGYKLKPMPEHFKNETNDLLSENDEFQKWFDEHFEIESDVKCSIVDIESALGVDNRGKQIKHSRGSFERLGFKWEKGLSVKSQKRRGGYRGFKSRENKSNEIDDNTFLDVVEKQIEHVKVNKYDYPTRVGFFGQKEEYEFVPCGKGLYIVEALGGQRFRLSECKTKMLEI